MKRFSLMKSLPLLLLLTGAGFSLRSMAQSDTPTGDTTEYVDTLATVDGVVYGLSYENEENFGNAVLTSSKGLHLPLPQFTNVEAKGGAFCLTVGVERLVRPFFKLSRKTEFTPNNYPKAFRRIVSRTMSNSGGTNRYDYATVIDYCTLAGSAHDYVRAYQEEIARRFATPDFAWDSGETVEGATPVVNTPFVFEQLTATADPANSHGDLGQKRFEQLASDYASAFEAEMGPARAFLFQYPRLVMPEAVTFLISTSNYNGGAHGYYTNSYVTLDLNRRRPLTFENTFLPEARERVVNILRTLMKQQKTRVTESGFYTDFCIHNPAILKGGVVFSFQPYEVACFADGDYHFFIPFELLSGCFTPEAARIVEALR